MSNYNSINYFQILGDYLVKNHSRHGIIVDNISYYGNQRPTDQINCIDQKKILAHINKFLNKRRIAARKHNLFRVYPNHDFDRVMMKYVTKIRHFDYKSMSKYYNDKDKQIKNAYRIDQCKCLKRLIPEDGYTGRALLRDKSLISIGCLQFQFTYNKYEVTNLCSETTTTKQDVIVEDQSLIEPCLRTQTEQDNYTGVLIRDTETEIPLVTIDDYESNMFNEQNNINTFGIDNPEDISLSTDSIQITRIDNAFYNNDKTQFIYNNVSSQCEEAAYTTQWNSMNDGSGTMQPCNANDLIQEVEVNEIEGDGENVEEEFVYDINYAEVDTNIEQNISDIQDWVIEEDADLEDKIHYNSNEPGPSSANLPMPSAVDFPVCDSHIEHYKTEHLYCATTQTFDEIIVISSDDEDYEHVENHKAEE